MILSDKSGPFYTSHLRAYVFQMCRVLYLSVVWILISFVKNYVFFQISFYPQRVLLSRKERMYVELK